MILSRVTLATIEAAAIDRHFASPATIAFDGRSQRGQALPSTKVMAGSKPSASTARIIALRFHRNGQMLLVIERVCFRRLQIAGHLDRDEAIRRGRATYFAGHSNQVAVRSERIADRDVGSIDDRAVCQKI